MLRAAAAIAAISVFLVAARCGPMPPPVDPSAPDAGQADATPEPAADAGSPCGWTCDAYRRLECEEGQPTAAGASCEEVCRNAAESGYNLARAAECLEQAQTCDQARECPKHE